MTTSRPKAQAGVGGASPNGKGDKTKKVWKVKQDTAAHIQEQKDGNEDAMVEIAEDRSDAKIEYEDKSAPPIAVLTKEEEQKAIEDLLLDSYVDWHEYADDYKFNYDTLGWVYNSTPPRREYEPVRPARYPGIELKEEEDDEDPLSEESDDEVYEEEEDDAEDTAILVQFWRNHFSLHGDDMKALENAVSRIQTISGQLGFTKSRPSSWYDLNMTVISRVYLERPKVVLEDLADQMWYKRLWSRVKRWMWRVGAAVVGVAGIVTLFTAWHVGIALMGISAIGLFIRYMYNRIRGPVVTEEFPLLVDTCTGEQVTPEFAGRYTPPTNHRCIEHVSTVCFTTARGWIWRPNGCVHNLSNGLLNRQLLPAIGDAEIRQRVWNEAMLILADALILPQLSSEHVKEAFYRFITRGRYSLARQRQLIDALDRLHHGVMPQFRIRAFTKTDEILMAKVTKVPRVISPPGDEYLVATAPLYSQWQKLSTETLWPNAYIAAQQRFIYTGCMTPDQSGELVSLMEQKGYWVCEGDFSRYDGHTEKEAILAEVRFYTQYLPPDVVYFLSLQVKSRGYSIYGHSYAVSGKVSSGVINTSFGNTLRNFMMAAHFMHKYYPDMIYHIVALGDDNMLFTEGPIDGKLYTRNCADFGHKLVCKTRGPADYDLLEYCSGYFWATTPRTLGPKLGRAFAKNFVATKRITKHVLAHAQSVALGLKYYRFLPGLRRVLQSLLVGCKAKHKIKVDNNPYKLRLRVDVEFDFDKICVQFERIYGFDAMIFDELCAGIEWKKMGIAYSHWTFDRLNEVDGVSAEGAFNMLDKYPFLRT